MSKPVVKRLIAPMAEDIDVERRERSWTFVAGTRRWSFTKVDYRASAPVRRVIDHRAPASRMPLTTIVGAALAVIGGATTLGLALHSGRAAAGDRYVLSLPLPSRTIVRAVPPVSKVAPAAFVQPSQPVVAPVAAVAPVARAVTPMLDQEAPAIDPVVTRLTAMQPAISAAFRTGQMQQWLTADGNERGFVVAGPAEGHCRTLSILIKRDGDNRVETRRQCPGGPIESTAAAPTGAIGDAGSVPAQ